MCKIIKGSFLIVTCLQLLFLSACTLTHNITPRYFQPNEQKDTSVITGRINIFVNGKKQEFQSKGMSHSWLSLTLDNYTTDQYFMLKELLESGNFYLYLPPGEYQITDWIFYWLDVDIKSIPYGLKFRVDPQTVTYCGTLDIYIDTYTGDVHYWVTDEGPVAAASFYQLYPRVHYPFIRSLFWLSSEQENAMSLTR